MKKLLLALLLWPSIAWGQGCTGVFPANTLCGNLTGTAAPPTWFSSGGTIAGPVTSTLNGLPLWANTLGSAFIDGNGHTIAGTYTWSGGQTWNTTSTFNSTLNITGSANELSMAGGSTGLAPFISANGSDASVGINFTTKGIAAYQFFGNNFGTTLFTIGGSTTAANFLQVNPANSGAGPSLNAAGSDSNIAVVLQPKGTGLVFVAPDTNPGAIQLQGSSSGSVIISAPPSGGNNAGSASQVLQSNGSTANWVTIPAVTVQTFTSGSSATYTPTAGTVRIHVRMAGGGGGGGAAVTNNGAGGNNTSFGGWGANGGSGGPLGGNVFGGAGGTGGSTGTGTLVVRYAGQQGGSGNAGQTFGVADGNGGSTPFFGGGAPMTASGFAGHNATANSGGGGAGGNSGNCGTGGGSGEYVEFWMTAAQIGANQTYTVGTGGNGGAAGTQAGGNGAAGIIIVEEFYL